MGFTHLHVHTEYSLLDGSSKINEIVKQAKKLGMTSLAITDHGAMYGAVNFYNACKKEGIKAIIGCEVYVAPESRFDKDNRVSDEKYRHLVLLVKNETGYKNLIKLVSIGYTEGFYYKPRIDMEVLAKYSEGLIALSACLAGEVPMYLARGDYEAAKKTALNFLNIFGEGNYYLELQDHGILEQKRVNQGILKLSRELGIPLVITNDVHYTYKEDAEPHDVLLCIQTGKKVTDPDRMRYEGGQFYLKSEEEMRALCQFAPEAADNTEIVASKCNYDFVFNKYKLPRYDVPNGMTSYEYLTKLCEEGLTKRFGAEAIKHRPRLEYEMSTIRDMGFVDYFLIVWDFIKYAKDNGIPVGPGRGSAAGSLVSYCLEITNINPIRFDLIFERFLNKERVSMPDIDIDFCYVRRPEVIDYVVRKYGKERVVQIVTFGTMGARGVIKDVARALDIPLDVSNRLAKMVPGDPKITLDKALEQSLDFKQEYESDSSIRNLVDTAKRLEGLPRHTSIHAAGVVISDAPVDTYVPLSRGSDENVTTQYTMTLVEKLGLLKMDFLGLRTLTVIDNALKLVNKGRKASEKLSFENSEYDDKAVYEYIASGKTDGVFQLESPGMTSFMQKLKPANIEEIIAGIALYRPGPMDFIPKYLEWRENPSKIEYDCPQLEPILKNTYGCIVYQEQVMQIVRDLAGYSYGRSDLVRRAMSKKHADELEAEEKNFIYGNAEEGIKGCVGNGISEEAAKSIFAKMMDFAEYAFNKSHAAAYAVVTYQTAYLKCHYPVEFMAALMTSVIDDSNKVSKYIKSCEAMKIPILPPDINVSDSYFTVENGKIRFGLVAIKGLGNMVSDNIIREREQNGKYEDFYDLVNRNSQKDMNKKSLESFIKSGALDSLEGSRRQKMLVYEKVISLVNDERKESMSGQLSLFDLFSDAAPKEKFTYPNEPDYSFAEKLEYEKATLGIYISGHPLDEYKGLLEKNVTATADMFEAFAEDDEVYEDQVINPEAVSVNESRLVQDEYETIGGIISGITIKTNKQNKQFAFFMLEDNYGEVECLCFAKVYEGLRSYIRKDNRIFVRGRVSIEPGKAAKLVVASIKSFDDIPKRLWINFPDLSTIDANRTQLYNLLKNYPGNSEVRVNASAEKVKRIFTDVDGVDICADLINDVEKAYGKKNIYVEYLKVFDK
ncbi:MAG: DNA polymerase III subunit alpha [Lachnospiraceae bacterium]|nr:DNA polymerase III subunit alpha [Lachnospiraceae bacterium]